MILNNPTQSVSARVQRRLAELARKPLHFDLAELANASACTGWTTTDLCQLLPGEPRRDAARHG